MKKQTKNFKIVSFIRHVFRMLSNFIMQMTCEMWNQNENSRKFRIDDGDVKKYEIKFEPCSASPLWPFINELFSVIKLLIHLLCPWKRLNGYSSKHEVMASVMKSSANFSMSRSFSYCSLSTKEANASPLMMLLTNVSSLLNFFSMH